MMNNTYLGKAMLLATLTLAVVVSESVRAANVEATARGDSAPDAKAGDDNKATRLVSLADSIDPVKEHFNANKGKHRFVTLLSPT